MKISVRTPPDGGTGWNIVRPDPRFWVWMDDRKVEHVLAADDCAGAVWVHTGKIVNGELELEKKTGKVEIRILNDVRPL